MGTYFGQVGAAGTERFSEESRISRPVGCSSGSDYTDLTVIEEDGESPDWWKEQRYALAMGRRDD